MRRVAILLLLIGTFGAVFLRLNQNRWTTIAAAGDVGFAIRITLGHGDASPQSWDGSLDIANAKALRNNKCYLMTGSLS